MARSMIINYWMSLRTSAEDSDLLKEKYLAIARQMPMMYIILVSSTWALAATHMRDAPAWLTIAVPVLLTVACALRAVHWWNSATGTLTDAIAFRALLFTERLAPYMAAAFVIWSFLLFPYGAVSAQSHVAFYMGITVIACIFCLMHLPRAAISVAVIVNGAFVVFFLSTRAPIFVAMAVNSVLVSIGILVVFDTHYRNFTRLVRARTEARRKDLEQSRLLHMIDDMPVAVMTVDPTSFAITYVNETSKALIRSIEHLLPLSANDLIGTSIDVFHRHPEHQRRILSDPANLPHHARIRLGPEVLDLQVSAVKDHDNAYLGPMLSWEVVTKEVEAEERILRLAQFDTLTGLANRNHFHELKEAAVRRPGARTGLLFIDLDGFKFINDSFGHRTGDSVLKQVADRLLQVDDDSVLSIGRVGGDEFAVLHECSDERSSQALAAALIAAIERPYHIEHDRVVQVGASIGIAIAPDHADTAELLLSRADMALYAAKHAGKGRYRLFEKAMERRVHERVRLEAALRAAIRDWAGLFVFYQPIVHIETGRITAREALIRWHHPEYGWIAPSEFIPIAEQSGLIDRLGVFVMDRACRDAVARGDGVPVAVNVSARQFGNGGLVASIAGALDRSGLPADQLEIEMTETALLGDFDDVLVDLQAVRAMGVRIALDDFGTGYSSLSHLRAFVFDKIKIDASFVRDSVDRPECAAIVHAVSETGKRLGVTTVAEGVETMAQLECVRREGCLEAQGFLFGKPMLDALFDPGLEQAGHR